MGDSFVGQDFRRLELLTQELIVEALNARMPAELRYCGLVYRYDGGIRLTWVGPLVFDVYAAACEVSGYTAGHRAATVVAEDKRARSDRARRAAKIGARKRAKARGSK